MNNSKIKNQKYYTFIALLILVSFIFTGITILNFFGITNIISNNFYSYINQDTQSKVAGVYTVMAVGNKVCWVKDYYDKSGNNDNSTRDQRAIQAAINDCAGQGEVRLSSGQSYIAGSIIMKSGVTFNLNNATLTPSSNPLSFQIKGNNRKIFIVNLEPLNNVKIIGPGLITEIPGNPFNVQKIELLEITNLELLNFTIDTVTGFSSQIIGLTAHVGVGMSENVIIDGLVIRGDQSASGNDGINLGASKHVHIRNCDIRTGDMGITFGGYRGLTLEDVLVEDCRISSNPGALAFGTEGSSTVKNVTIRNVVIHDVDSAPYGAAIRFRAGGGGTISNLIFSGLTFGPNVYKLFACESEHIWDTVESITKQYNCVNSPSDTIRDICFENFTVNSGGGNGSEFRGDPISKIKNVKFLNMIFRSGSAPLVVFENIDGLTIANFLSHLNGGPQKDLKISNVSGLNIIDKQMNCYEDAPFVPFVCNNDGSCGFGENTSNCPADCKTCSAQSGNICSSAQTCPVNFIFASDSSRCCPQSCVNPAPAKVLSADFNCDNKVDIQDFAILLSNWDKKNTEVKNPLANQCQLSKSLDLLTDGLINAKDLPLLLSCWGTPAQTQTKCWVQLNQN